MSALSPAEIITQSFYAWEVRGRGWQLADYPVFLEPPFRHCFVLPELVAGPTVLDDGKRSTFLSTLVDGLKGSLGSAPVSKLEAADVFEEPQPYPALDTPPLTAFQVTVPREHASRPEVAIRLLLALSACFQPVSFEIIGHDERVRLQVVCADADQALVSAQLMAYFPDASVVESEDLLAMVWNHHADQVVVDIGLSQEFFLPLQSVATQRLDPYVSLIPALALAGQDEVLMVQILFQGVRNPWARATHEALDDGQGGSVFADAPDFSRQADEKLKTPLFATVVRVVSQASDSDQAWGLARSTNAFFLQYARPGANEFVPLENDGYPDELHAEAVLTRQSFRTGMLLSVEELAALVHLPDASIRHPALVRDERRTKAAPESAIGHPMVFGENLHRGKSVAASVSETERLQHTWLVGASGTGKSTLLLNLIEQDIGIGNGVAVLDPHGDLIDDILARIPDERLEDVVLFDPSDTDWPIGFNIFASGTDAEHNLLASDLVGIFRRFSTSWGDTMSAVLGNAVLAILEHPGGGTLLDLRRFLVDERFRREHLQGLEDEEIAFFWSHEYPLIGSRSIGPILTRLDTFLRPKVIRYIVGQKDAKLDCFNIMQSKKIFLAKLSHGLIGEENAYLLGSLLVGKFLGLALARQQLAQDLRQPFFLYADEFQHFLTPSVETLLTAARKYRLGVTLAHQTMGQLSESPRIESALLGNAYSRIVFRIGESDARKLAEGFSAFEASDMHDLGRGEAIVRLGSSSHDFNLRTFPSTDVTVEAVEKKRAAIAAFCRGRYAVPAAMLKARLREQYGQREEAGATAPASDVPKVEPVESRDSAPSIAVRSAVKNSIDDRRVRTAAPPPLGRGGQEHKYLQHLIKRLAEERGFRAIIEEAAGDGRADVALIKEGLRIACEVSITTDPDHETENLKKCASAGFQHIVFVVPEKRRREKLRERFRTIPISVPVVIIGPEDIVGTFDALDTAALPTETTVRGYKVTVTRQTLSPEDVAGKRAAIAGVIARSITRRRA